MSPQAPLPAFRRGRGARRCRNNARMLSKTCVLEPGVQRNRSMSMRKLADGNGPHRLVNSMTRYRRCRSSLQATDPHIPSCFQPLCPRNSAWRQRARRWRSAIEPRGAAFIRCASFLPPLAVLRGIAFVRGIAFLRGVPRIGRFSRSRLKQALDPTLIHLRHAAGEIDHQPLPAQDVRAPRHDDVPDERHRVLAHVEGGGIPGRILVLLSHDDVAFRLDPADLPVASGPRIGCLDGLGGLRLRFLLVENDELLAAHFGVALQHVHVTGEGRHSVLLTQLERRRADLHRFVAVLRKALQRAPRTLIFLRRRIGPRERAGDDDPRHREQCEPIWRSTPAHGLRPPPAVEAVLSIIKVTNTPRSKRMRSPESATSMRLALMVHVAVFTSTGFSEVILLPRTSTTASLRNA